MKPDFGPGGANLEIPPFACLWPNLDSHEAGRGTVYAGQFDWGGLLQKGNGGAQRSVQRVWKPRVECKSISWLYCETDKSSSRESGL